MASKAKPGERIDVAELRTLRKKINDKITSANVNGAPFPADQQAQLRGFVTQIDEILKAIRDSEVTLNVEGQDPRTQEDIKALENRRDFQLKAVQEALDKLDAPPKPKPEPKPPEDPTPEVDPDAKGEAAKTTSSGVAAAFDPTTYEAGVSVPTVNMPGYVPPGASATGPTGMNNWWTPIPGHRDRELDELNNNPYMHQLEDLMRGNARRNINSKDPRETLRLARLADALNNTYYRNPTYLRSGVVARGGQYLGSQGQIGSQYQMPIETEETRQMERARGYEGEIRSAEVGRQQETRNIPLKTSWETIEAQLRAAGLNNEEQLREVRDLYNYQLQGQDLQRQTLWNTYAHMVRGTFDNLRIPQEQANLVLAELYRDPAKYNVLSSTMNLTTPSVEQATFMRTYAANLQSVRKTNSDGSPRPSADIYRDLGRMYYKTIVDMGMDMVEAGIDAIKSRPAALRLYIQALEALRGTPLAPANIDQLKASAEAQLAAAEANT